jgi:hypothetical protein
VLDMADADSRVAISSTTAAAAAITFLLLAILVDTRRAVAS